MDERLSLTKIQPKRVADIGCATGDGVRGLQRRYPAAQAIALDYAVPMLLSVRAKSGRFARLTRKAPQLVNADANSLPLAAQSVGLIWSNLMLHWFDDPLPALREMHRVLEVGGLVMFTAFGPDTLKELRTAMTSSVGAGAESRLSTAEPLHGREAVLRETPVPPPLISSTRAFIDMHDLGDMLMAAGFSDPVMDMEMISLNYSHPRKFLADQRHLGVRNALLGRQTWQTWRKIFAQWQPNADGRFPMNFEIIYGHAWKPAPRASSNDHAVMHFHRRERVKI
ncbi:MAG: methyltransferase domain-containing protein [Rhodocyclaceae bacterium]|nr:methyltransferase domain-containing protein [Rhodocyclaceae bacterium]